MAHYTLNSGKRTQTITSRCPICLTITYHASTNVDLTDVNVCCRLPKNCRELHRAKLWKLWATAQRWGKVNHPELTNDMDRFDAYMLQYETAGTLQGTE